MAKDTRIFRTPHVPATAAHVLERTAFSLVRSSCSFAAVVDAFIDHLATNCWKQYDVVANTFYGFKSDSGHWVSIAQAPKELIDGLPAVRASKLYMELKSGIYGFASYRDYLEALRPEIDCVYLVDGNTYDQHLKAVLQLKNGTLLELDICRDKETVGKPRTEIGGRDGLMPRVDDNLETDSIELDELEEIL